LKRILNALCLICRGGGLLAWMQPAPFLQQLLLSLAMRRVGHTGTCRAYLSTVRCLIGSNALGASVRINGVCGADSLVGAPWPTVSAQPGNCSALFSDDFVGYRLSFLSSLAFTIVTFPLCNVNWEAKRPSTNSYVQRGGPPQADTGRSRGLITEGQDSS
jgi:hypothetical protein